MKMSFSTLKSCTALFATALLCSCGSDPDVGQSDLDASNIVDALDAGDAVASDAITSDLGAPDDGAVSTDSSTGSDVPADSGPSLRNCIESSECRGGEVCRDGACREVCAADNPCDGQLNLCDESSGLCVQCLAARDCSGGFDCRAGLCQPIDGLPCTASDERCSSNTRVTCVDGRLLSAPCGDDAVCLRSDDDAPICATRICEPEALGCDGDDATLCNASGTALTTIPCDAGTSCEGGVCVQSSCEPGSSVCRGNRLAICDEDGSQTLQDCDECPAGSGDLGCACVTDACVPRICQPASRRCAAIGFQVCTETGLGWGAVTPCDTDETCLGGECAANTCEPGTQTCVAGDVFACTNEGDGLELLQDCQANETCRDATCVPQICTPSASQCSGTSLSTCAADGLSSTSIDCRTTNRWCNPAVAACAERVCQPDSAPACSGNAVVACNADGSATQTIADCGTAGCTDGACNNPCAGRSDLLGCEFFTADFEQIELPCSADSPCMNGTCSAGACINRPTSSAAAVVIHNPGISVVNVSVFSTATSTTVRSFALNPGQTDTVTIPTNVPVVGSQLSSRSFRIVASQPVAAWHSSIRTDFFAISTADLTRLIPVDRLDVDFAFVGLPGIDTGESPLPEFRPMLTVIAPDDNSDFTVVPSIRTLAGTGVTAIAAGSSRSLTLGSGQLLSLVPFSITGDLSGTRISATRPVAVFSTFGCAQVTAGTAYCDFLIEQQPPSSVAGTSYVALRSDPRGSEPDVFRVTALNNNTTVSWTALSASGTGSSITLAAGQSTELLAFRSALITSTQPVIVHQYFVSSEYAAPGNSCPDIFGLRSQCALPTDCDQSGIGDPSMAMPVATTRWSPSHLFYVPPGFSEDYVSIVVPTGASVFLDGSSTSLSLSRTSLASTYQTMVLPISDGLHSLTSSQPFGILVHGFTCGASYGYAGEWR
jgi:hypothetical protein